MIMMFELYTDLVIMPLSKRDWILPAYLIHNINCNAQIILRGSLIADWHAICGSHDFGAYTIRFSSMAFGRDDDYSNDGVVNDMITPFHWGALCAVF